MKKAAQQYRDLLTAGVRQPKPAIARSLQTPTSYVGKLLAEARRQNLLCPTTNGSVIRAL